VVAMALIAAIGILIAFVILAVEIVVTIIEFHIVTLVAFVTVPFGVLTQTSFMSERAIGYVVSVGIKLMALAIVVSLGTTVFDNYT
ncbi:type IV secretion system protein, partial [Vibrio parahaemolyticus]